MATRRLYLTSSASMLLVLGLCACDDTSKGAGSGEGQNNAPNNSPNNDPNNDPGDPDAGEPEPTPEPTPEQEPEQEPEPGCQEGERRCAGGLEVEVCRGGAVEAAPPCLETEVCEGGQCLRQINCDPGLVQGCFDEASLRVCNAEGSAFVPEACDEGLRCLAGQCTDMICIPNEQSCIDRDTIHTCDEAGMGFGPPETCPEGALCLDGRCLSGCDLSAKFPSYIGCRYWSLDLDQYNDPFGDPSVVPHAVVLSNPSDQEALVRVTATDPNLTLDLSEVRVPPNGGIAVYTFPRHDVDGTGISNRSFFLESTWPVVAYQFNPLNNEGVASNDASLLLPIEALGTEYIALSWPTSPVLDAFNLPPQHGYITIVAATEGRTTVRVIPSGNVEGGDNVPFLPAGELQTFTLRRGQVLNLEAAAPATLFEPLQDMSGTEILSDKPIVVFGGHEEAVVGMGCCAEHLEQQMYPVTTWGNRYLAAQSESRGGSNDVWRVVASVDGTQVETIPPQPDAATFTLNRGQWRQIEAIGSFEVVASGPIMVGQYLKSQEDTGTGIGDPSFILAAPIDSFRRDYAFLTPEGYQQDWVTVMRPAGALIILDGRPLPDSLFVSFGTGEYEYAWVSMEDGSHSIEGELPFGLSIYGFSNAVSYGFTGGMDLRVEDTP